MAFVILTDAVHIGILNGFSELKSGHQKFVVRS